MRHALLAPILAIALATPALAQSGGRFAIDWYSIDGGGRTVQLGAGKGKNDYIVGSTVGQIDAGPPLCAGGFRLDGGFWAATLPCPADFDGDGFITGIDFDAFTAAFEEGTLGADFDCDGFITGQDFDYFTQAFERGCGK